MRWSARKLLLNHHSKSSYASKIITHTTSLCKLKHKFPEILSAWQKRNKKQRRIQGSDLQLGTNWSIDSQPGSVSLEMTKSLFYNNSQNETWCTVFFGIVCKILCIHKQQLTILLLNFAIFWNLSMANINHRQLLILTCDNDFCCQICPI